MARICFYCGKELKNGETCNCRQAQELNANKKLRQKDEEKSYLVESLARNSDSNQVDSEQVQDRVVDESHNQDDSAQKSDSINNSAPENSRDTKDNTVDELKNNHCEVKNDEESIESAEMEDDETEHYGFGFKRILARIKAKREMKQLHARFSEDFKSEPPYFTDEKSEYASEKIDLDYETSKVEANESPVNSSSNADIHTNNADKRANNVDKKNSHDWQSKSKKIDGFIHSFVDKFTQKTNKNYDKAKQSYQRFYRAKGKNILNNLKRFCFDLLRGPDMLISRASQYKRSTKIFILFLSFFLNAILFWRIAATTSLGKFLDYSNETGMIFSFAQLLSVFIRTFFLSALFFVARTFAYKYVMGFGLRAKKSWNEMMDLQIAGYIYSIVFDLFAIILAQGSGVSSFFLLAFAFVVQVLLDFIYLMDVLHYDKNRSFQILIYVNFVSLLLLAMFIRWVFPSISHYSVISCPWLWN